MPNYSKIGQGLNSAATIAYGAQGLSNAVSGGGGGGGFGGGDFPGGAIAGSQAGTSSAIGSSDAMMSQIKETAAAQMKFQTEMGIVQLMVKMNEALAKMFKAIGEAVKNLA